MRDSPKGGVEVPCHLIIIIAVTEQTAQLICSGKKSNHKMNLATWLQRLQLLSSIQPYFSWRRV